MVKNQTLENKIKEYETLIHDHSSLKNQYDKQSAETQIIHQDKQKLYEEIMALKDLVSMAKSETKEKILTIQFIEKEKDNIRENLDQ